MHYYNLERLLEPFDFNLEIQDKIIEAKLLMIKLKPYDDYLSDVTFRVNSRYHKSIYDRIRTWFDRYNLKDSGFNIVQAKLMLRFYDNKNLVFLIGHPTFFNITNITSCHDEDKIIILKYLKKWQLLVEQ